MSLLSVPSSPLNRARTPRKSLVLASALLATAGAALAATPREIPVPWLYSDIGWIGGAVPVYIGNSDDGRQLPPNRYEFDSPGISPDASAHFLHQTLPGDGEVSVRVLAPTRTSFVGLQVRASSGDIQPFQKQASLLVKRVPGSSNDLCLLAAGNGAAPLPGILNTPRFSGPVFIKIARAGATFQFQYSTDGVAFTNWGQPVTVSGIAANQPVEIGVVSFGDLQPKETTIVDSLFYKKGDAPAGLLGGNTSRLRYVDLIKTARLWQRIKTDPSQPYERANVDAQGWPAEDFNTLVYENFEVPDASVVNGLHHLVWEDRPGQPSNANAELFITEQNRNTPGSVDVASYPRQHYTIGSGAAARRVHVQPFNVQFAAGFYIPNVAINLRGTNGGAVNVRVIRPGYRWDFFDPAAPAASEEALFNPANLTLLNRVSVFRQLDFTMNNNSMIQKWTDRSKVSDVNWNRGSASPRPKLLNPDGTPGTTDYAGSAGSSPGSPYELGVALCNKLDTDLWLLVPIAADNEFVEKLAKLVLYGSDGVNPYDGPVANPVWRPLAPHLKVYLELSNEVWNPGFEQQKFADAQAARHISGNLSPSFLTPGASSVPSRHNRWYTFRSAQVSKIFRDVFAARGRPVRPILSYQNVPSALSEQYASNLEWLDQPATREALGLPRVKDWLFGVANAAYYQPAERYFAYALGEGRANFTASDVGRQTEWGRALEEPGSLSGGMASSAYGISALARFYGVTFNAYEIAPRVLDDIRGISSAGREVLSTAWYDEEQGAEATFRILQDFDRNGGYLANFFTVNEGSPGGFNVTPAAEDARNRKLEALDDYVTLPAPAPTIGDPVPGVIDARLDILNRNPAALANDLIHPDDLRSPRSFFYLVNAPEDGQYDIFLRGAGVTNTAKTPALDVSVNNSDNVRVIQARSADPRTEIFDNPAGTFTLTKGLNTLRVSLPRPETGSDFSEAQTLDSIKVTRAGQTLNSPPVVSGTSSTQVSTVILGDGDTVSRTFNIYDTDTRTAAALSTAWTNPALERIQVEILPQSQPGRRTVRLTAPAAGTLTATGSLVLIADDGSGAPNAVREVSIPVQTIGDPAVAEARIVTPNQGATDAGDIGQLSPNANDNDPATAWKVPAFTEGRQWYYLAAEGLREITRVRVVFHGQAKPFTLRRKITGGGARGPDVTFLPDSSAVSLNYDLRAFWQDVPVLSTETADGVTTLTLATTARTLGVFFGPEAAGAEVAEIELYGDNGEAVNGGFELGSDLTGWTATGDATLYRGPITLAGNNNSLAFRGRQALRLGAGARVSQPVTLEPSKTYQLYASGRLDGGNTGAGVARVYLAREGVEIPGTAVSFNGRSYSSANIRITTPANTTGLQLVIERDTATTGTLPPAAAYVDDVHLVPYGVLIQ